MGLFDHSLNWVLIILFVLDVCGATWKFGFFISNFILLIVDRLTSLCSIFQCGNECL
jgi:hypothetical protein